MQNAHNYIPEGFSTVTSFLVVKDTQKTFDFYERAFGAKKRMVRHMPDGKVMHAEFQIGNSTVMVSEEMEQDNVVAPSLSGPRSAAVWLYLPNVDEVYQQAIAAGGISIQQPVDAFWGDRLASVIDPSGHLWHIATHKEELTSQEIDERAEAFFKPASNVIAQEMSSASQTGAGGL